MELSKLKKCDMSKPYIFISYSSANRDLVWEDVYLLQQRGYNIWIDDKMIDKTKSSWENDAIEAITTLNCKLLIFYVSKESLASKPCLNEMRATVSEKAKKFNRNEGRLQFLAVDAEEIDNFDKFTGELFAKYEEECDSNKYEIMGSMCDEFFDTGNARVRILYKDIKDRKTDYYSEIEASIPSKVKNCEAEAVSSKESQHTSPVDSVSGSGKDINHKETKDSKSGKHSAVNVKKDGEKTVPTVEHYPAHITQAMTLDEFERLFDDNEFVYYLRFLRANGREKYSKQMFDYTMAALLRGCDAKLKEAEARWKYCVYAVSKNTDLDHPQLGSSQFTWQSNSRKAVEIAGSGKLGENSEIFANIPKDTTMGEIERKFARKEKGFITKSNDQIENVIRALYGAAI